jgi:hypothetical protein
MAKMSEKKEAWFRIIVAIVSGIILKVWGIFICVLVIVNWFIVVFSGKKKKDIYELCEPWNIELYKFVRYMTFVTNDRPFPFSSVGKR